MEIKVQEEQTLIEALALMSPDSSKTTLRSWLKEKRITVDGRRVENAKLIVSPGQTVALGRRGQRLPQGVKILHEGSGFVVIDKPAGLLSVSTDKEKRATAYAILKKHYAPRKVTVVHRLDRETSGVMLFGLGQKSKEALKELFEKHDIERGYFAIVEGTLEAAKGTWRSYIYEDANYVMHTTNDKNKGKLAVTHYKVIRSSKGFSLLDIRLETGRKNQVRIHCSDASHPVVGDSKYGATTDPIKRLCLHAYLLAFKPPGSEKTLRFESPAPKHFNTIVDAQK